jgi:hypothetical protein
VLSGLCIAGSGKLEASGRSSIVRTNSRCSIRRRLDHLEEEKTFLRYVTRPFPSRHQLGGPWQHLERRVPSCCKPVSTGMSCWLETDR